MTFELDKKKDPKEEPSLATMTKAAINILQKNSKGYFLMVEGELNATKWNSHLLFFYGIRNLKNLEERTHFTSFPMNFQIV